jgi:hypothetical protein
MNLVANIHQYLEHVPCCSSLLLEGCCLLIKYPSD